MQTLIQNTLKSLNFPNDIFEMLSETIEDYDEYAEKPMLFIYLINIDISVIINDRYHIIDKLKMFMIFLSSLEGTIENRAKPRKEWLNAKSGMRRKLTGTVQRWEAGALTPHPGV